MKPEIKKLWVEALRSGEYTQGSMRLFNNESFCCLGVLCDLHAKETGGQWEDVDDVGKHYLGCDELLPEEVVIWSGIKADCPYVSVDILTPSEIIEHRKWAPGISLTALNDGEQDGLKPRSFEEISNAIEKYL